jgi:hypothetical protein
MIKWVLQEKMLRKADFSLQAMLVTSVFYSILKKKLYQGYVSNICLIERQFSCNNFCPGLYYENTSWNTLAFLSSGNVHAPCFKCAHEVVPVHHDESIWGNGGIAALIFNFSTG